MARYYPSLAEISRHAHARSPESGQRADKADRRSVMLDLLDQQNSLTINQWKIFTACVFSIVIDFFDFALIGFVLAFFVKD